MAQVAGRPASSSSFERLYRRHVEDVYRYALGVLANRSDAEDVTQTTFLNAYRSYRDGTLPAKPLNWLIAIAHNVCRQRFRSAARRPREVALDPQMNTTSDEQIEGFRAEDIQRALSALTFTQRSALAMRELEGRSYREIAQMLELTESAVETLIFRARKAFREQLEGTMTCNEAEQAISRQLDGALDRHERGALRSHLRACEECSVLARRFRAQRSAFKRLVLIPLPQSLASFTSGSGVAVGGGAALGGGLGIKALAIGSAAIVAAAGVTTGEIATHSGKHDSKAATPQVASPVRAVRAEPAARTLSVAAATRHSTTRAAPKRGAGKAGPGRILRPRHSRSATHVTTRRHTPIASAAPRSTATPDRSAARKGATGLSLSLHKKKGANAGSGSGGAQARQDKPTATKKDSRTTDKTSHSAPQAHSGAGPASQSSGRSGPNSGPPSSVPAHPGTPTGVPAAAPDPGSPADTPPSDDHPDSKSRGKSDR